jgi:GT2 family glycosyltransferase
MILIAVLTYKIKINNCLYKKESLRMFMVTIIIPNYNGKHFMEPCLEALENQTYKDFEIMVVDNASSDGSNEYIEENYPDIKLIKLDKNYGFSKAVNVGIKASKSEFVILLNNDTEVHKDYVLELVDAISKNNKIFSVACKMIQYYHRDKIDNAGDLYTVIGWAARRGLGRSSDKFNIPCRCFSCSAGSSIYRREVFDEIGFFDESHFAYLEDVDIGYRARIYGYENRYEPNAICYHVGSGTSGSEYNEFKIKLSSRNNIYLNYKNMPPIQFAINFLPILAGNIVKYFYFNKMGFGKAYLEGIKEGLANRFEEKRVPYKKEHFWNYVKIEVELIYNTFIYGKNWISRYFENKKNVE